MEIAKMKHKNSKLCSVDLAYTKDILGGFMAKRSFISMMLKHHRGSKLFLSFFLFPFILE